MKTKKQQLDTQGAVLSKLHNQIQETIELIKSEYADNTN